MVLNRENVGYIKSFINPPREISTIYSAGEGALVGEGELSCRMEIGVRPTSCPHLRVYTLVWQIQTSQRSVGNCSAFVFGFSSEKQGGDVPQCLPPWEVVVGFALLDSLNPVSGMNKMQTYLYVCLEYVHCSWKVGTNLLAGK